MKKILKYPFYLFDLIGSGKSFSQNPVIGNDRLNAWGLHKWRVQAADVMAGYRRRSLGRLLDPADREQLRGNGYLIKENYLPDPVFRRLKSEIYTKPLAAREMRQGRTITRMIALGPGVLKTMPATRAFLMDDQLRDMMHFAASCGGEPVFMIHGIMVDPNVNITDPQTDLHSDTFHPTSKAWYFLHDVGPDDGPFVYVPRSHLLTPERLQWEYEQSLSARRDPRSHHGFGSFRITASELQDFGFVPKTVSVKANTLVIADTRGFHGRTPSHKPTMRISLDLYLRRSPFLPWNDLDIFALPFLKGRSLDLYLSYLDLRERKLGKKSIWRDVGSIPVDAPART